MWIIRHCPRDRLANAVQVEWDSSKDKLLWDLLSQASSRGRDIDCKTRYLVKLRTVRLIGL